MYLNCTCAQLPRRGPSALPASGATTRPLQLRTGVSLCHHVTLQRTSYWSQCLLRPTDLQPRQFPGYSVACEVVFSKEQNGCLRVNQCPSVNTPHTVWAQYPALTRVYAQEQQSLYRTGTREVCYLLGLDSWAHDRNTILMQDLQDCLQTGKPSIIYMDRSLACMLRLTDRYVWAQTLVDLGDKRPGWRDSCLGDSDEKLKHPPHSHSPFFWPTHTFPTFENVPITRL